MSVVHRRSRKTISLAGAFADGHRSLLVVASLSPRGWPLLGRISPCRMIEALKFVGFTHVSETAWGRSAYRRAHTTMRCVQSGLCLLYRLFCPAANALITKYYPSYVDNLAAVASPAVLHARMLRRIYGPDTAVVGHRGMYRIERAASARRGCHRRRRYVRRARRMDAHGECRFSTCCPVTTATVSEPFEARTGLDYVLPGRFMDAHGSVIPGLETCSVSGVDNA